MDDAEKRHRREVLEALGQYQRQGRVDINQETIEYMVAEESDRGLVIILGSWVEDALLDRIFDEFPDMEETQRARLAKSGAPLRDFATRTTMARAMGLIDDEQLAMLDAVRSMRNACAHSRNDISFKTPQLRDALMLILDDADAEVIQSSDRTHIAAIGFISAVGYLLGILRGLSPDEANRRINVALHEASETTARPAPSQETQTGTQLPDFRSHPKDKGL